MWSYMYTTGHIKSVWWENTKTIFCWEFWSRVAYRIFFMGGGHTLVWPLGDLVACSPRKCFVFYVRLWHNSGGGGGGGLKLEGGNSSAPPPPPPPLCMQPCGDFTKCLQTWHEHLAKLTRSCSQTSGQPNGQKFSVRELTHTWFHELHMITFFLFFFFSKPAVLTLERGDAVVNWKSLESEEVYMSVSNRFFFAPHLYAFITENGVIKSKKTLFSTCSMGASGSRVHCKVCPVALVALTSCRPFAILLSVDPWPICTVILKHEFWSAIKYAVVVPLGLLGINKP